MPSSFPVAATRPRVPQVHLIDTEVGARLLVVDGSRLYGVSQAVVDRFESAMAAGPGRAESRVDALLETYDLSAPPYVTDEPPAALPVRSLSLAVAQKCNLACTYCYAQGGDFGGSAKSMPRQVAHRAVDRLFDEVTAGQRLHLAFLGGEPLVNRRVLRSATERAAEQARRRGVEIGFAVTTNGTLLRPDDGDFFERHGFAVTVSLDGLGAVHDRLRPFRDGRGSSQRILERLQPLLRRQHAMQVSARVTVTPRNLELRDTLDALVEQGFHSIGFSPMLASPTGRDQMQAAHLEILLEQMIACGREAERRLAAGERYPFSNLHNALKEIHRGTHRPYPCGAGGAYFGVSAEGGLFACHRFVDDPSGAMGDLDRGVDPQRQAAWLSERHVHRQEPCRSCWARYLCGGGCHHEVIHRGRPACDFIRGWLHYCLGAYARLLEARPDFFA